MNSVAVRLFWIVAAMAASQNAHAYFDFVPTAAEWVAWPEHCRVQYTFMMREQGSEYGNAYSAADFDRVKRELGEHDFLGIHHYCAGLHWYTRGLVETRTDQRNFKLNNALDEALFSYRWVTHTGVMFPEVVTSVARVYRAQGETKKAVQVLETALLERPESLTLYGGLAVLYREQGQLTSARDILIKADELASGKSAEIKYNLGLIELELGQTDRAAQHAVEAYQMGYPLPGLRNKLQRLGSWPAQAQAREVAADGE